MVIARCPGTNDKDAQRRSLVWRVVDGRVTDLRYGSGKSLPREVIAVAPRFVARSPGR